MPKQIWMIVGGNGAGKTTFYKEALEPFNISCVNADELAKSHFPDDPEGKSKEAASLAEQLREQLIQDGVTFCFETVFSHPSKVDFIAKAKSLGYKITLVFIHAGNDHTLNIARVHQRKKEGGHGVPEEKILSRIPRTLENVRTALPLCDEVFVLDNSSTIDNPFKEILSFQGGKLVKRVKHVPDWAQPLYDVYAGPAK